jgi:hypothetical protein
MPDQTPPGGPTGPTDPASTTPTTPTPGAAAGAGTDTKPIGQAENPATPRTDNTEVGPGNAPATVTAITIVGIYLIAFLMLLLYLLMAIWPQPTPGMSHSDHERILAHQQTAQEQAPAGTAQVDTARGRTPPVDTGAAGGTRTAASTTERPAPGGNADSAALAAAAADRARRHQPTVMPGPGVQGVPGFYHCKAPDSTKVWIVHQDDKLDPQCVSIFGKPHPISNEQRLVYIVLLCGALGALLHGLRSLRWYVGTRWLKKSWVFQYYMFPFTGALLALGIYSVLRGGFFSPGTDVSDTNPVSFAAAAFLVGLFSEEAIEKLREIAKAFFTPKPQGPEKAPEAGPKPATDPAAGDAAAGGTGANGANDANGADGADAAGGTTDPAAPGGMDAEDDSEIPLEETGDAGLDDLEDDVDDAGMTTFGVSAVTLQDITGDHAPDQLQVRGNGFTAGTQVEVDGVSRAPTFHDSTLLTLDLLPVEVDKLAALGTLEVIAVDPGPPPQRSQPVTVP